MEDFKITYRGVEVPENVAFVSNPDDDDAMERAFKAGVDAALDGAPSADPLAATGFRGLAARNVARAAAAIECQPPCRHCEDSAPSAEQFQAANERFLASRRYAQSHTETVGSQLPFRGVASRRPQQS